MIPALLTFAGSARGVALRVLETGLGDCVAAPCNYTTAIARIENGATVGFDDAEVSVTAALSDLFHAVVLKNVSLNGGSTVIRGDGGLPLLTVDPVSNFLWGRIRSFTFSGFNSAVILRTAPETVWPLIIFEGCLFADNNQDVINVKGGTFQFDRCTFKNNSHRPLKIMSGTTIELTDTTIRDSNASFFYDCDLIIRNSRFINNTGARGGAFYLSKATFLIEGTKFINNSARSLGGVGYISETGPDLASEVRTSCFIGNQAPTNGTSFSSSFSEVLFRENCFSDSETASLFGIEVSTRPGNVFGSNCESCLSYEAAGQPFDPLEDDTETRLDGEL
jgi:hypothetical protein